MDRCGDSATSADEVGTAFFLDRHNGCVAKQTTKFNLLANSLAAYGDDSYCGGLVVYHTD